MLPYFTFLFHVSTSFDLLHTYLPYLQVSAKKYCQKLNSLTGCPISNEFLPCLIYPLQIISQQFLRFLTATMYSHLTLNNLLLTCSVKNFKKCSRKLSKSGTYIGQEVHIFFTHCDMKFTKLLLQHTETDVRPEYRQDLQFNARPLKLSGQTDKTLDTN